MVTLLNDATYIPIVTFLDELTRYATSKPNLTVRINIAKTKNFTEPVDSLVEWAKQLGVQEVTINEMIRANQFSKEEFEPLGGTIRGYEKTKELGWGLTLYAPVEGNGPSVAICRFGDESFAEKQSKDLYLLPNGSLSQYLFERGGGIDY